MLLRTIQNSTLSLAALLCAAAAICADSAPDYAKDGFAFLERHCVECHGDKVKKSGLTLLPYKDEAAVLKDRAVWKTVMTMVAAGEMPPEKKPRPNGDEIAAFSRAVAGLFEKADRNAKPDAGRVAMHRLNRAEYNNTVRDLLNIDFNASEDFPADEVGHGFDNISDVQWISPVHMERYLAAAESIAQRVIALEPVKPPHRQQSAQFLEPAGPGVPKDKYRMISGEKPDSSIATGPLNTPYRTNAESEYIFKAKLYAMPYEPKKPATEITESTEKRKGWFFDSPATVPKAVTKGWFVDKPMKDSRSDKTTEVAGAAPINKGVEKTEITAGWFFDKASAPETRPMEPIRVAMLGCGINVSNPATDAEAAQLFGAAVKYLRPFQILKIVEVKARGVYSADILDVKIPKNFGLQRIALAIVKPASGPIPRVYVEWLGSGR